jgi:hypothetical protein
MIYVEYEAATSLTDAGWWAVCDDCQWKSGPHPTKADADRAADEHGETIGELVRPPDPERQP